MSDIRDVIADALARLFPPSTPDPRIPALEGNLFGPRVNLSSPLGEMDQRALMREAQEMPEDPRINAYRQFEPGIRATPWWAEYVNKYGEAPDLNTPDYDYRAAWAAGARPTVRDPGDQMLHWPSRFKGESHPNRYVDGIDTITGEKRP